MSFEKALGFSLLYIYRYLMPSLVGLPFGYEDWQTYSIGSLPQAESLYSHHIPGLVTLDSRAPSKPQCFSKLALSSKIPDLLLSS